MSDSDWESTLRAVEQAAWRAFSNPSDSERLEDAASNTPLKPIETEYDGYHFRSRLEARWAVFLSKVGIEFLYEPEGFDLGDGIYYLPDFYLPQVDLYAEVKPKPLIPEALEKCRRLAQGCCGVLLLVGMPDFKEYDTVEWLTTEQGGECIQTPHCLDVHINKHHYYYTHERRFFACYPDFSQADASQRYIDAVHAARSHRFEGRS